MRSPVWMTGLTSNLKIILSNRSRIHYSLAPQPRSQVFLLRSSVAIYVEPTTWAVQQLVYSMVNLPGYRSASTYTNVSATVRVSTRCCVVCGAADAQPSTTVIAIDNFVEASCLGLGTTASNRPVRCRTFSDWKNVEFAELLRKLSYRMLHVETSRCWREACYTRW